MEPTKAQKNGALVNEMKSIREEIQKLTRRISSGGSSRKTSMMVTLLEELDHNAVDRLVELGMVLKLEDSNER